MLKTLLAIAIIASTSFAVPAQAGIMSYLEGAFHSFSNALNRGYREPGRINEWNTSWPYAKSTGRHNSFSNYNHMGGYSTHTDSNGNTWSW